ncbi:MAG: hypothetical protein NTZ02_00785 [Candidatus Woesearchaeota archaeon]|nr:hypothetical protein [Candidatus Woesearchaeota archaeon]
MAALSSRANVAPIINSSMANYSNGTVSGWCNATDADGDNVSYSYTWYLNGVANLTSSLYKRPHNMG